MKMSLWITHHTTATSNHDSAWWEEILTFYLHFQQASVYNFSGWVVMWMSMLPCIFPVRAQWWQCYLQCSATNSISKPRPQLLCQRWNPSYFHIFFQGADIFILTIEFSCGIHASVDISGCNLHCGASSCNSHVFVIFWFTSLLVAKWLIASFDLDETVSIKFFVFLFIFSFCKSFQEIFYTCFN